MSRATSFHSSLGWFGASGVIVRKYFDSQAQRAVASGGKQANESVLKRLKGESGLEYLERIYLITYTRIKIVSRHSHLTRMAGRLVSLEKIIVPQTFRL